MDNELVLVRTTSNIREVKKRVENSLDESWISCFSDWYERMKDDLRIGGIYCSPTCKYVIVVDKKRGKKNAKKQIN